MQLFALFIVASAFAKRTPSQGPEIEIIDGRKRADSRAPSRHHHSHTSTSSSGSTSSDESRRALEIDPAQPARNHAQLAPAQHPVQHPAQHPAQQPAQPAVQQFLPAPAQFPFRPFYTVAPPAPAPGFMPHNPLYMPYPYYYAPAPAPVDPAAQIAQLKAELEMERNKSLALGNALLLAQAHIAQLTRPKAPEPKPAPNGPFYFAPYNPAPVNYVYAPHPAPAVTTAENGPAPEATNHMHVEYHEKKHHHKRGPKHHKQGKHVDVPVNPGDHSSAARPASTPAYV